MTGANADVEALVRQVQQGGIGVEPDREARVDSFFFEAARRLPERAFLLGGSGWEDKACPPNVVR